MKLVLGVNRESQQSRAGYSEPLENHLIVEEQRYFIHFTVGAFGESAAT